MSREGSQKGVKKKLPKKHFDLALKYYEMAATFDYDPAYECLGYILVLGAFGCGAFQNDPEVVSRAYKTALDEFPKLFKKIEFAVYCPAVDTTNYSVFKRVFDES